MLFGWLSVLCGEIFLHAILALDVVESIDDRAIASTVRVYRSVLAAKDRKVGLRTGRRHPRRHGRVSSRSGPDVEGRIDHCALDIGHDCDLVGTLELKAGVCPGLVCSSRVQERRSEKGRDSSWRKNEVHASICNLKERLNQKRVWIRCCCQASAQFLLENLVLADCTSNRSRVDGHVHIIRALGSLDCDRAGNQKVDQSHGTAHHPLDASQRSGNTKMIKLST